MTVIENKIIPWMKSTNVEIFYGSKVSTNVTATGWATWTKPKNVSMVFILCMGSGAGGGGGLSGASLSARGGGAGGGSGGFSRLLIPAVFLPRKLYLLPGCGGIGGGAGTQGASGQISTVNDAPNALLTTSRTILCSGAIRATVSGAGTSAGSQSGPAGETVTSISADVYAGSGLFYFIGGILGGAGAALGADAPAIVWGGSGIPVSPGAGGGSVDSSNVEGAGGAITGAGLIPTIAGGAVSGGAGRNGIHIDQPWLNTGGSGGGSFGTGTGGRGGDGAYGCGGGGGGGGVTGGAGGDGGPGMIMIASW